MNLQKNKMEYFQNWIPVLASISGLCPSRHSEAEVLIRIAVHVGRLHAYPAPLVPQILAPLGESFWAIRANAWEVSVSLTNDTAHSILNPWFCLLESFSNSLLVY